MFFTKCCKSPTDFRKFVKSLLTTVKMQAYTINSFLNPAGPHPLKICLFIIASGS